MHTPLVSLRQACLTALAILLGALPILAQEDFRATAPAPGPPPEIDLGDYETFTLDNGLTVIVVENHKLPRISVRVFVDVPLHLEGEEAGLATVAGDLISAGTTERSKAEIDEAVDFIGASLSSSSSGLFGASLTKHRETLLEIMSEVLLQPAFPEDEFDKIKTQLLSGLSAGETDPNTIASNLAQVLRYGADHPYGEPVTPATVKNISLEQARNYYETYFRPDISYLVMVGDLNTGEARQLAETYFGSWAPAAVPAPEFPMPSAPEGTQVSVVDLPSAVQSVITVTYPVDYAPGNPMALSGSLMNQILGGGFSARLNQNLREDKGYTYGIGSSLSSDEHVGYFTTSASVRNEVTDSAITQILSELQRLVDEPVSQEELDASRNESSGAFARSLESPQTIANFALNTIRYELPEDYYPNYLDRLDRVTPEDIQAAAQRYIRPEGIHIAVVGNYEEIREDIMRFDSDGTIALYDPYGRPVQAPEAAPVDISGEQIVRDYLEAIGGMDRLQSVEDVSIRMTGSIQGQPLEMTTMQKAPNKIINRVSAGGMVVQEQKYDGERGVQVAMGQKQELQGEQLDALADQAKPFPEMRYLEDGYELSVQGITDVDGQKAYQVEVKAPDGDVSTEYYSVDSRLKIKGSQTQQMQGQTITITNAMDDYREVKGILWPHKISITGAMPMPLNLQVEEVKVNEGIEDAEFMVE